MKPRGRKPQSLQGRGEIRGDAIYPTTTFLRRLGTSRNTLASLRKRGLPVHSLGRRCSLIYGWEFVAFLRDQSTSNAPVAPANPEENAGTVPATVPDRATEGRA